MIIQYLCHLTAPTDSPTKIPTQLPTDAPTIIASTKMPIYSNPLKLADFYTLVTVTNRDKTDACTYIGQFFNLGSIFNLNSDICCP